MVGLSAIISSSTIPSQIYFILNFRSSVGGTVSNTFQPSFVATNISCTRFTWMLFGNYYTSVPTKYRINAVIKVRLITYYLLVGLAYAFFFVLAVL